MVVYLWYFSGIIETNHINETCDILCLVGVNLNKAYTLYNDIVVCGVQVIIGSILMKAAPVTQNTSSVTLKTRGLVSNQRRKMYVT